MSEVPTTPQSDVPAVPRTGAPQPGSRRVLLVEPDASIRSLLEDGLWQAGFEVLARATPAEVMAALGPEQALPVALLLEARLEGMDGFAWCAQLRAEPPTARLPIVLLARAREESDGARAQSAGAVELLSAPLLVTDVVARVKLECGEKRGEQAITTHTEALPLAELTRALLAGIRSGRVAMKRGDGMFLFKRGRVTSARFGDTSGESALGRMLALDGGEYTVTFTAGLERGEFSLSYETFTQQVLPRVRKCLHLLNRSVPSEARLVVDFDALSVVLEQLPDGVNRVLRLFDGRRSVRQVAIECELDETATLEVIARLHGMGVLEPVGSAKSDLGEIDGKLTLEALFESAEPPSVEIGSEVSEGEGASGPDSTLAEPGAPAQEAVVAAQQEVAPAPAALASEAPAEPIAALAEPLPAPVEPIAALAEPLPTPAQPLAAPAESLAAPAESLAAPAVPEASPAPTSSRPGAMDPAWYERLEQQLFGESAGVFTPPSLVRGPPVPPDLASRPAPASGRLAPEAAAPEAAAPGATAPEPAFDVPSPSAEPGASAEATAAAKDDAQATIQMSREDVERSFFEEDLARFARGELSSDDSLQDVTAEAATVESLKARRRVLLAAILVPLGATILLVIFLLGRRADSHREPPRASGSPTTQSVLPAPAPLPPQPPRVAPPEPAPASEPKPAAEPEGAPLAGPLLEEGIKLYDSGKPGEAAKVLAKVVVARPVNPTAWLMLGIARFDSGDPKGAEEAASKALTLDPKNGRAIMLLASVYLAEGQRPQADDQLKSYLSLEPRGPFAREARELLKH